ncbi:MAG: FAD-dependent oxidoreductase [Chloroflexia bacterium]
MIAYDLLSMDKSLDSHTMLSKKAALARVSRLNPEGLKGAALYYDAQVEYAERLVLENVLSARNHGATVQTYHRVDKLVQAGDVVVGVEYTDVLTGRTGAARSTVIINVAGPWVDDVLANSRSSKDETVRMIGGTKGSHIVVRPFAGAPQNALYVEALQDHRPYFIIPWNNLYLIGTTDVPFEGDPNNARADEAEIQYLIDETNRVLPSAELDRASVLSTYSGVRPLPYQSNGRGDDSPTAGAITRRHIVHDHAPGVEGLISIVGGKLTTYRRLAEQAVDMVYRKLDRPSPPSRTASLSLPGGGVRRCRLPCVGRLPRDAPQTGTNIRLSNGRPAGFDGARARSLAPAW